ncbi:MAG: ABC transporter permease [Microscillaceae bacterium]|nr:ABC transporter permease [Microscillaceae bacterium]
MNFYYFVAQRLGQGQKSFSSIVSRIAIVSIALGLATVLVAFGILLGFQHNVQQKLFSFSGHLRVIKRSLSNAYEAPPLSIHTDLYQRRAQMASVQDLYAFAQKAGILKTDTEVWGVILKGLGKDYPVERFKDNILIGKFPISQKKGYSSEILISKKVADRLQRQVGDSLLMFFVQDPPRFRKLRISGIYQTGMEEFDENIILGDINLIRRLNEWPDSLVGGYEIWAKDFTALEEKVIPEVLDFMNYDMGLESITDRHIDIFDWLNLLNKNVAIFLGLILVVASFNIVSILLIMIMERVRMIGLLKALGASNRQVRRIFIYKGLLLVLRGMGWGNAVGLGFCALQYYFRLVPLNPENYYMSAVPIEWDWGIIMVVNLLTLGLIALVLLLPTLIISQILPVKAIRFD